MSRRSPIAIDFGSQCVTALQLERCANGLQVRAAGRQRVPVAADGAGPDARVEAARQLLRRAPFRGNLATTALGLDTVTTRHLRIHGEGDTDPGEQISARLHDAAAGDDGVVIQPLPVAELFEAGERRLELLCCIAPEPVIEARIALLERLRLRPQAIELAPLAQLRALLHSTPRESFAHLDLGADHSRLGFVRAGQPFTVRRVPVGGEACRQLLEQRLGIELPSLQALGDESELDASLCAAAVVDALAEPIEQLVQRLTEGIRYCGALFQGRAVNSVRVTGRLAHLPGLTAELGRRIGLRTETFDPLTDIAPGPLLHAKPALRSGYTTAIGLCLGSMQP
ncbi:MAG: pilus assembly protein PilM [Planctomycetes bacterium]|jgi:Tfp pilus assembly PilM family ATPase|nr:pilus assembly protein PilM [Planctomycetota bacterium]